MEQKICEIHEIRPEFLNIDLSDFDVLTFDDGLYTQYLNIEHFLKFKKRIILFISTAIVNIDGVQLSDVVHCADAHNLFFHKRELKNYMTWEQIKELASMGCEIGGHSHTHPNIEGMPVLEQIPIATREVAYMMKTFNSHGIKIKSFCYPYNYRAPGYKFALMKCGVTELFGPNRIPIESLI